MTWILLSAAILTEVGATLCLRASDGLRQRWWLGPIVVGYVVSFTLLALTLRHGMAVGVAYGIWAAVGVALTAIAGRTLFGDPLTRRMVYGLVLIVGGVLCIEMSTGI